MEKARLPASPLHLVMQVVSLYSIENHESGINFHIKLSPDKATEHISQKVELVPENEQTAFTGLSEVKDVL